MAAVSNLISRLRISSPPTANAAAAPENPAAPRSPEQIIAGCEYELRQVRRDVLQTKQTPPAPPRVKPLEPFVMGAGLRGRAAS